MARRDNQWTLGELGRELGISKERVRRIASRALRELRDAAEAQKTHPVA